jgi:uncharacterized protein (TIGR00297 family)
MSWRDLLIGAVFAAIVAALALRAGSLTRSGAWAAFVVGTLTFGAGSAGFALILLAFFVPSVMLSRLGRRRKRELVDIGKHGARDAVQVLVNGGGATACAVVWAFTHHPAWAVAFAGAYAAAAADTAGTEIGTLARGRPRSILTWRAVPTGLSGGISLTGTVAEFVAALWIGVVALIGVPLAYILTTGEFGISSARAVPSIAAVPVVALLAVPLGGIAGAVVDSLLGATLQELRWCDACERSCESDPHVCGTPTRRIRGVPGWSNDMVNLLCAATGAAVAAAVLRLA